MKQSPTYLFIILLVSIFITEMIIMLIIPLISPSPILHSIIDPLMLVAVIFPLIYLFAYRPLILKIAEMKDIQERLKQQIEELERFQKATAQREFRMKELIEENERLNKRIRELEKKD